jgi:hypothetical protein
MRQISYIILICFCSFSSCEEEQKPVVKRCFKPDKTQSLVKNKEMDMTLKRKNQQKVIYSAFLPAPCPIDPEPPFPDPEPIDPPGYIPEPPDPEILVVAPKTIRDSIVSFPFAAASYGNHPDELFKFIDHKIANSTEWSYLKELGYEGKIYIRLLIDTKGKVREVTFLKFTDPQLEILMSRLSNTLIAMPNWMPAKDEHGQSVVSEFTFPLRIQFE